MIIRSFSHLVVGASVGRRRVASGLSRMIRNEADVHKWPSSCHPPPAGLRCSSSSHRSLLWQRQEKHLTCSAAAAAVRAEDDEAVEEDNDDFPTRKKDNLVTTSTSSAVERTLTMSSKSRTRLAALREKLQQDPPTKSFLRLSDVEATTNPNHSRKTNSSPKIIHWKELLDQSTDAPPLPDALPHPQGVLTDRFGRHHNYLRISLAERCNLRCTYCMPPEGVPLQPESFLLQTPEILKLAQHFQSHGVNKIRLTGGEPTLRKDLVDILKGLSTIGGFEELAITTNGVTLARHLEQYMEAGLNRVNISLDTLHPKKFEQLTRRPAAYYDRVWQAIELAASMPPDRLIAKINVVVMKGTNDNEVADFCALQQKFPNLHIRFIEYMPFTENGWNMDRWVPYRDLLQQLERQDHVKLRALPPKDPNDTTKWYTTNSSQTGDHVAVNGSSNGCTAATRSGGIGRIGFITSMSQPFCGTCNRLRLTSDGQIKVCLFDGNSTVSLRDALREGADEQNLDRLIQHALRKKHFSLGGHKSPEHILEDSDRNRPMTLIGG